MENKGNPYHDSNTGQFTSGSNQASPELKNKLSNMGFGPSEDEFPEFDADIDEDGSLVTRLPMDFKDQWDNRSEVSEKDYFNFVSERFGNVLSSDEIKKIANEGYIPTKLLADYGYENQEEFEEDFEQFAREGNYQKTRDDYEWEKADDAWENR